MSSPLFCDHFQAGGCILPRDHQGRHKIPAQRDAEILSAERDRLAARVAELEAANVALLEAADLLDAAYEFVVHFGVSERTPLLLTDITAHRATLERHRRALAAPLGDGEGV